MEIACRAIKPHEWQIYPLERVTDGSGWPGSRQ
jgi:hypothetical protein